MSALGTIYKAAGWWNEHWGRVKTLAGWLVVASALCFLGGGLLIHQYGLVGGIAIIVGVVLLIAAASAFAIDRKMQEHPPAAAVTTTPESDHLSASAAQPEPGTLQDLLVRGQQLADRGLGHIVVGRDDLFHWQAGVEAALADDPESLQHFREAAEPESGIYLSAANDPEALRRQLAALQKIINDRWPFL